MKTLTLILLTLTLLSCEKTDQVKKICNAEYLKFEWDTGKCQNLTLQFKTIDPFDIIVKIDNKHYYDFVIQNNSVIFSVTNEIKDKVVEVEVFIMIEEY